MKNRTVLEAQSMRSVHWPGWREQGSAWPASSHKRSGTSPGCPLQCKDWLIGWYNRILPAVFRTGDGERGYFWQGAEAQSQFTSGIPLPRRRKFISDRTERSLHAQRKVERTEVSFVPNTNSLGNQHLFSHSHSETTQIYFLFCFSWIKLNVCQLEIIPIDI